MSKSTEHPIPGLRLFSRLRRAGPDELSALRAIGVGDLSDCMHGMGVMDAGIRPMYAPMGRVYGPAVTVDLTPGDGLLLRAAVEAAQPGDVIVATSHGVVDRAILGGAVAMHMVHRGVAALVVDGAIRDLAEFRALGLPVMARAVMPRSGTSSAGWGDLNVPIACGGVVVSPGDIISGDDEGIAVVPQRSIAAVIAALGNTGHSIYDPEGVVKRLRELGPDAKVAGSDNLHRALKERHGTILDRRWDDQ